MTKHFFIIVVLFLFAANISEAQNELYKTSKGYLLIKVDLNGTSVDIRSDELMIMLDYETGGIVLKQKVSSLMTDNDSIRSQLKKLQDVYLKFEGKLGLDYVNTVDHPPVDFQVEGTLLPQDIQITGKGHLEHIAQKTKSVCLLTMDFMLNPEIIFPDAQFPGIHNKINVKVIQSLLGKVKG